MIIGMIKAHPTKNRMLAQAIRAVGQEYVAGDPAHQPDCRV